MALRTQFTIHVVTEGITNEDTAPLLYEFGWREAGKTRVQPLHAALYVLSVTTVLPCGKFSSVTSTILIRTLLLFLIIIFCIFLKREEVWSVL